MHAPRRVIGGFVLACSAALQVMATAPDAWFNRPFSNTNTLNGVACGNGLFVAAGNEGTILTSANGSTWILRSAGPRTAPPFFAAFSHFAFVVGGRRVPFFPPSLDVHHFGNVSRTPTSALTTAEI